VTIRPITPQDDIVALTGLLHRAYAPLAARGLYFTATHQPPAETAQRLFKGHPLAAEVDGLIVGTITVYRPNISSKVATYRDPHTYMFGQFGVEPAHGGHGIGRALHQAGLDHALRHGARFMSLDTAEPATDLIATYTRWGYSIVERTQWKDVNYPSVIMRRPLVSA
jgi:GNAT superfamily N-acetyltransferase